MIFKRMHGRFRTLGRWAAAIATLLASALIGFILFFPAESLRPRLVQEAARRGVQLEIGTLSTTFPPALLAQQVKLNNSAGQTLVTFDRLRLRPSWFKLLIGSVELNLQGTLLGGRVEGRIARSGDFALQAQQLAWDGPLPGLGEALLSGRLRQATASGTWPPRPDSQFRCELAIEETRLDKLPLPGSAKGLALGTISVHASGKGKSLTIDTLAASGGQITATGDGTLLLAEPLLRSALNLTLRLRPAASLDPGLASLMTALLPPGGDGASLLRLGGTLAAPRRL